jgi:adenylate cyclase
LGVRYVLEGSVRKGGDRVRITGQLIDALTGVHLWADRFDGALDNVFDLQDQAASSVAGAIEPKLRQSEIERASRKPTESLDAYDLYLRALALRDRPTAESVPEAIALLRQALAIDPAYTPAKALVGFFRVHEAAHGRDPVSEADAIEAVALAKEVLRAGKDDPDALWMAASTLIFLAGERDIAAAAIDRALTLNPNAALAWAARVWVDCPRGQPDAAIEACKRAMRLSPLDPLRRVSTFGMAIAHAAAGRYEEALDWVEQTLHAEPSYWTALRHKASLCARLDRIEEAREAVRQLLEAQPWHTVARSQRALSRIYGPELAAKHAEGLRKAGLPEE